MGYDRKNVMLIDGHRLTRIEFEAFVCERWGDKVLSTILAGSNDLEVQYRTLKLALHAARIKELEKKIQEKGGKACTPTR